MNSKGRPREHKCFKMILPKFVLQKSCQLLATCKKRHHTMRNETKGASGLVSSYAYSAVTWAQIDSIGFSDSGPSARPERWMGLSNI